MAIKCIAIDDEPLALQVIKTHVMQMDDIELVDTFQNPIKAFDVLKTKQIDLIFLDIEMPLLSGIDFLKTLQNPPKVIFTTAYRNYAVESYEFDVVDYLLKPISFTRFFKAIGKFKDVIKPTDALKTNGEVEDAHDHIYVNANKRFVKVEFGNINYVESIKDYVRIHLADGTNVITKDSISNFEEKLPHVFLRIHRSFIVNTTKVTAFTKVDVEINDIEIPIGNSYKNNVITVLKK